MRDTKAETTIRRGSFLTGVIFSAFVSVFSAAATAQPTSFSAANALKAECPKCQSIDERPLQFQFSGLKVVRAAGVDAETHQPRLVYVDDKGDKTTFEALDKAEAAARFDAIGRMEPALAELVDSLSEADSLPVYIVAPVDLVALEFDRGRIARGDLTYRGMVEDKQEKVIYKAYEELALLLSSYGYMPDFYVPGVPAVHVVLLKADVELLSRHDEAVFLFRDFGPGIPTSATWLYSTGLDQPHDWFVTGDGIKLAVLMEYPPSPEAYDGSVHLPACNAAPIDLGAAPNFRIYNGTYPYSDPANDMLRTVATANGCNVGLMGRDQGAAPGVSLYMGAGDNMIGNVEDWARSLGALVYVYGRGATSAADGGGSFHDFVVDYRTRISVPLADGNMHYVASAGNRNGQGDESYDTICSTVNGYVQNKFYNGIVVGGSMTLGTIPVSDDVFDLQCSSYENRSYAQDWELPNVVAPAMRDGVDGSSYSDDRGTSISAAIVGGLVSLILSRNSGLKFAPEAVRAIIEVTAWKNVEGPELSMDDLIDDKDGAGLISAPRAVSLSDVGFRHLQGTRGWWDDEPVFATDFDGNGNYDTTFMAEVKANHVLRATANWTATPRWILPPLIWEIRPDANLDLCYCEWVNGACSGATVCSSADYSNWEFLMVVNGTSATKYYRLSLVNIETNPNAYQAKTYLGVAWDTMGAYPYEEVCDTPDGATASVLFDTDTTGMHTQNVPDIAALNNEEYVVVWASDNGTGNQTQIAVELLSKDGVAKNVGWLPDGTKPVTPYVLSAPDIYDFNTNPRVGVLNDNHYAVVWQTEFNPQWSSVYYREFEKYDPINTTSSRLDSGSSAKGLTPDISDSVVDTDETPSPSWTWKTWLRTAGTGNVGWVFAKRTSQFPIWNASPASGRQGEVMPTVAAFPDKSVREGGAVIAFIQSPGDGTGTISGRCINANGGIDTTLTPDSTQTAGVRNPAVGMFDDGSFVVAWHDVTGNRIKYRLYSSSCVAAGSLASELCGGSGDMACTNAYSYPDNDMIGRLGLVTGRLLVGGVNKKAFRVGYMTDPNGSRVAYHQLVTRLVHVSDTLASPVLEQQDIVQQESVTGWFDKNASVALAMDPACGSDLFAVWAGCSAQAGLDVTDECNVSTAQHIPQFDMGVSLRPVRWPLP